MEFAIHLNWKSSDFFYTSFQQFWLLRQMFKQYYFEGLVSASSSQSRVNMSNFTMNHSAFVRRKCLRLSWHCPCSHWSMNAFTLARTSKLLFGPRTHFVRVFVEQTGRLWRSLGPEPQKDARPASKWTQCGHIKLRKHLWSWGCKGTPPRRLHNTGATRKVSSTARRSFWSPKHTHTHS